MKLTTYLTAASIVLCSLAFGQSIVGPNQGAVNISFGSAAPLQVISSIQSTDTGATINYKGSLAGLSTVVNGAGSALKQGRDLKLEERGNTVVDSTSGINFPELLKGYEEMSENVYSQVNTISK